MQDLNAMMDSEYGNCPHVCSPRCGVPEHSVVPAWAPLENALMDYMNGRQDAAIRVLRDDGRSQDMHAETFFTRQGEFSGLESVALDRCGGRVLDVGAGAGRHTLELQRRGVNVCAIDVSPVAVEIMTKLGVRDARCGALSEFRRARFDTLLFMMNGIGVAGSWFGLKKLLAGFDDHVAVGGRMVFDSWDFRAASKDTDRRYYGVSAIGRPYPGETRYRLQYDGLTGAPIAWLFIDPDSLVAIAGKHGLTCRVLAGNAEGGFVAELSRLQVAAAGVPHAAAGTEGD